MTELAEFALSCGHMFFDWPPISPDLPPAERETELRRRAAELDWNPADGDEALLTDLRLSGQFAWPQEQRQ